MSPTLAVVTLIVGGAFGLAMLSVALSQKAQTSSVIQAGAGGLAAVIKAAVSPVASSSSTAFGSAGIGG